MFFYLNDLSTSACPWDRDKTNLLTLWIIQVCTLVDYPSTAIQVHNKQNLNIALKRTLAQYWILILYKLESLGPIWVILALKIFRILGLVYPFWLWFWNLFSFLDQNMKPPREHLCENLVTFVDSLNPWSHISWIHHKDSISCYLLVHWVIDLMWDHNQEFSSLRIIWCQGH